MNKQLGYRIFACLYTVFSLLPPKKKQVFLVMTHDSSFEGNVGVVEQYLKDTKEGYRFARLVRTDTYFMYNDGANKFLRILHALGKAFRFFVTDACQMARSSYIFLDNTFLPMAYMKFRKQVRVVQLWHGTGTLKKLGQDVNEGALKQLENLANRNVTDLVVSSRYMEDIYGKSFAIPKDKIRRIGLPRTDIFFDEEKRKEHLEAFYQEFPMCRGKKLLLYAPTFRDNEKEKPALDPGIWELTKAVGEDTIIALRMHPFVAHNIKWEKLPANVMNFSSYQSLNTLLFATSLLITDYSSIMFEYVVLNRPMVFYAYDLAEFSSQGRGFYQDYESYVPGPVAKDAKTLIAAVEAEDTWEDKRQKFVEEIYEYTDGASMERLADLLEIGKKIPQD